MASAVWFRIRSGHALSRRPFGPLEAQDVAARGNGRVRRWTASQAPQTTTTACPTAALCRPVYAMLRRTEHNGAASVGASPTACSNASRAGRGVTAPACCSAVRQERIESRGHARIVSPARIRVDPPTTSRGGDGSYSASARTREADAGPSARRAPRVPLMTATITRGRAGRAPVTRVGSRSAMNGSGSTATSARGISLTRGVSIQVSAGTSRFVTGPPGP